MKFLTCSRCFSIDSTRHRDDQPIQEITNPLVITKRPAARIFHPQRAKKPEPSVHRQRFPAMLSALTSWSNQPRSSKQKQSSQPISNVRKSVQIIQPTRSRRGRNRPATRTQRLIRLYEDRASQDSEESPESHQNFRNKLNTLDLKRMNTVALEEPVVDRTLKPRTGIYGKNSYDASEVGTTTASKSVRKTMLEDFLKERLRIEQTMIDLFNGKDTDAANAKQRGRGDDRKVCFKIEGVHGSFDKDHCPKDNTRTQKETEVELLVDPATKVEDFYVERRTTYLKNKTVEDKAVVLKIGHVDGKCKDEIGMATTPREMVFCNFQNLTV